MVCPYESENRKYNMNKRDSRKLKEGILVSQALEQASYRQPRAPVRQRNRRGLSVRARAVADSGRDEEPYPARPVI